MSKFQRKYELTLETATGSTITITDPLTLEFSITRDTLASANTADFRIFNLGEFLQYLVGSMEVFHPQKVKAVLNLLGM